MATLFDYVFWRGDLTLAQDAWRPADSALLASLCYLNPGDPARGTEGIGLRDFALSLPDRKDNQLYRDRRTLCVLMAGSRRWGEIRISRFVYEVNPEAGIQFAAFCAGLPDGTSAVCYRGTDASLVGWREDFELSYASPVPAQTAAVRYLEEAPEGPLLLLGHSKGGNLAAYAAAHAPEAVQGRIRDVWSFDGPGLDDATIASAGYQRVRERIHSLIPQSSVIGLLMDYHPDYTIVRADAASLMQHNLHTWQMDGPSFAEVAATSFSSQLIDRTLHDWLKAAAPEERQRFVESVFHVLEASGARTLQELGKLDLPAVGQMMKAVSELREEDRKLVSTLFGRFFSLSASSAVAMGRDFLAQTAGGSSFLSWLQKGGADDGKNN